MFITLDKQNMRIVHKHPSKIAITNLVYVELPDVEVSVCSIDMLVKDKTDIEIRTLFKAFFPKEDEAVSIADMKSKILQFAWKFPVTWGFQLEP